MMKRKRNPGRDAPNLDPTDTTRPPKRKRNVVHEAPTSEEIQTARQLHHLLTFEQDLRNSRHGLQSFKELLDGIVNDKQDTRGAKYDILTQYLDLTKPREFEDEVPVYLPDIMETWSLAAQLDNEIVMSAVVVVLALLLRVISDHVELVPTGLGIARTILQKRQQDLLAKNLSAQKGRDFIISPALRLVREIICLDGGALAAPTFRARNFTLKSLARNMGLRYLGEGVEDPQRPSIRTNAVRVFMSCLKYLQVEAKKELLYQKDVVAALMRELREDPSYLILEILHTLRDAVVLDSKLSKDVKIRLLNAQSLIRISSLYTYHHGPSAADAAQEVQEAAHTFLIAACTTTAAGIIRPQGGYYPDGIDSNAAINSDPDDVNEPGLESVPWMDKFNDEVPVRNTLLAEFIQTLRPWSSLKQNELLTAIFTACPELVANYYTNKRAFGFDPKLSATWIGYSTLLFNTIRLNIPPYFGHPNEYAKLPPPTSVVLGNILPLPLDAKTISRCLTLTQNSKLISFFAIRLLVVSLEKLAAVLEMHRQASLSSGSLWKDAARRLVDEFCRRMPNLKDVIVSAYRALSDDDLLQRVAVTRCLLLYHEVIPQVALAAKFDFSSSLSTAIKRFEVSEEEEKTRSLRLIELENISAIAEYSPGMKWFSHGKDFQHSPFMTLLRLFTESTQGMFTAKSTKILLFVAEAHGLVTGQSQGSGIEPLMKALRKQERIDPEIWAFLDNCVERCARSPIKYQELIMELRSKHAVGAKALGELSVSPLMMTMVEQLPFAVSSVAKEGSPTNMAVFLSDYLGLSRDAGIPEVLLKDVLQRFKEAFGKVASTKDLFLSDLHVSDDMEIDDVPAMNGQIEANDSVLGQDEQQQLEQLLHVPVKASKDNNAVMNWASKTPEELVEEGYTASVIWLLASEHPSIRREALTSLNKIALKVKESSYEENEQVWLLLSELTETAKLVIGEGTMPNTILAFVCRALDILKSPTHALYPKLNTFLTRGPIWDLDKVPMVQEILHEGPTADEAYYTELSWLLSYLLDSLRSTADVAVFHKRKVFERVMVLISNPYMGPNLRTQILRIIYRATTVEGGSDTLVTRFGGVSWLSAQGFTSQTDGDVCRALAKRLCATCSPERLEAWAKHSGKDLEQTL
ncbi:ribosome 60S biogenesis N-terminal-domain-containing protein [Apiospora arundinis]|uniref:Ribosome 60S biogenesis N-terminal-domain-containing protein n=1 Tax=Apiospora arundinis TaxID=335852 RepID=A0ABR2IU43_9PEZI